MKAEFTPTDGKRIRSWIAASLLSLLVNVIPSSFGAELAYAPAPVDNPLKGFMSRAGRHETFPHSLEFSYVPLRTLMTGLDDFNWQRLEKFLDDAASRGHQTVFRVYLDWPGRPTALPQFLVDAPIMTRTFTESRGGYRAGEAIPDYEDPQLRAALTNFITALGKRYDGDPRIGFIEAGLLGSWGEWHVWGQPKWFASETVQREVLEAYEAAFHQTKVVVRWPAKFNADRPLGYHDDWFGHRSSRYPACLEEAGIGAMQKWRTQPIGGRVHPEFLDCLWTESSCDFSTEELVRLVETSHASWLLLPGSFKDITGNARGRALEWARRLGYELHVSRAEITGSSNGALMVVSVTMTNTGVAPFYYPWPVELAAYRDGELKSVWRADWDVTKVIPRDGAIEFNHTVANPGLDSATYRLLMRLVNPLANGLPLRFANESQDADKEAWLTLGEFRAE